MPHSRPVMDDVSSPARCAERLRAQTPTIVEQSVETLRGLGQPYRRVPEDALYAFLDGYLDALADAIFSESAEPVQAYLNRIDDVVISSELSVADIIRGLQVVSDVSRRAMSPVREDIELVRTWARESTALIADRSVAALTRQLEHQLAGHRQSEERLLALQRVSSAVLKELDLDRILQTVVEEAMQLMHATAAAIRLIDEDGTKLRRIASVGEAGRLLGDETTPVVGSLVGHAFLTGKPVMSNDVQHDDRLDHDVRSSSVHRSLLIVPLIVRDAPIGVLLIGDCEDGVYSPEDQRLLSLFADQASTAIEHARLYRQAQSQVAELAALQRISSVISSSLDLDEVFRAIYEEIRGVMALDAFIIGLAREEGRFDLEFIMDDGQRYAPRHDFQFSPAMNRAIIERRPVIIDDVRAPGIPQLHTIGHPETRVRSIVNAPLLKGNEVVGQLSAQSYTPHNYKSSDAQLLMTIANNAVVAIEHARLYAQAQTFAIAEERNRLAREIHDTLAQGLIGITLYLERLDLAIPDADQESRKLVQRALNLSRSNLEEARRSVRDLRAAPLEGRTLIEALHHIVHELRGEGAFSVDFQAPTSVPLLAARVETALFRVVQESLSNCRKHAECSNVSIDLTLDDEALVLKVADDGLGFDLAVAQAKAHRFGLSSMRERVEQVGGTLEIESKPGDGTTVRTTIPLRRALARDGEQAG